MSTGFRETHALSALDLGEPFSSDLALARRLDAADPLASLRSQFHIPKAGDIASAGGGTLTAAGVAVKPTDDCIYLTGNSLGCMPVEAERMVQSELEDWKRLAVEAHVHGRCPWLHYHEVFKETGARLVGAKPGEVVMMNQLTVNLHLLMVSFYRPTRARYKIIIEDQAFPSDSYAVGSQAAFHAPACGFDAASAIVRLAPRQGEWTLRTDDILQAIEQHGPQTALVMLGGVNYLTGQFFDMPAITQAAQRAGAVVGWDLAHAAGNVPMQLHEWGADFAAWCSYKFLNAGPGAIAGAFVHQRHHASAHLPRFAGWWGNEPAERFTMRPEFVPRQSADGWQLSNPPILAMAPLRASLEIFDGVGMPALRAKALRLTGYMEALIDAMAGNASGQRVQSVTPRNPAERGCALSLIVHHQPREAAARLRAAGVVCDFREPNIMRAAPVPLYNSFEDVWKFVQILDAVSRASC